MSQKNDSDIVDECESVMNALSDVFMTLDREKDDAHPAFFAASSNDLLKKRIERVCQSLCSMMSDFDAKKPTTLQDIKNLLNAHKPNNKNTVLKEALSVIRDKQIENRFQRLGLPIPPKELTERAKELNERLSL